MNNFESFPTPENKDENTEIADKKQSSFTDKIKSGIKKNIVAASFMIGGSIGSAHAQTAQEKNPEETKKEFVKNDSLSLEQNYQDMFQDNPGIEKEYRELQKENQDGVVIIATSPDISVGKKIALADAKQHLIKRKIGKNSFSVNTTEVLDGGYFVVKDEKCFKLKDGNYAYFISMRIKKD